MNQCGICGLSSSENKMCDSCGNYFCEEHSCGLSEEETHHEDYCCECGDVIFNDDDEEEEE